MRNLREGPKWVRGTVIERTGPVSYRVQVSDQIWCRHTDQILESNSRTELPETDHEWSLPVTGPVQTPTIPSQESVPPSPTSPQSTSRADATPPIVSTRYPRREHRPPDRLSHQTS